MIHTAPATLHHAVTDATLAYYSPAAPRLRAATPAQSPALAALALMFGYYDQN